MIWIFKERGIPKGDALVTFEDPQCVQKAIKWYSGSKELHYFYSNGIIQLSHFFN